VLVPLLSLVRFMHCCMLLAQVRGCARITEEGLSETARLLPYCKVLANTHAVQLM
jgi:hypothetical protein